MTQVMYSRTARLWTDLFYEKNIVKGGEVSRAVPVNTDGRRLRILLFGHMSDMEYLSRVRCFRRGKGSVHSRYRVGQHT